MKKHRVTLLNSCYFSRRKDQVQDTFPHIRIGIASIAGWLREKGHYIKILDPHANNQKFEDIITSIKNTNPDFLCLPSYTDEISDAYQIAKVIKNIHPRIKTVIGGPHISALGSTVLEEYDSFDYGIVGKGEEALSELVSELEPNMIQGLVYRSNTKIKCIPERSNHIAIDDLPYMPWDLYDLKKYGNRLPIEPLRSCPFDCNFCFKSTGKKVDYKSPGRFIKELQYYIDNYNIKYFYFTCGSYPLRRKHTLEISNEIISKNVNIQWESSTRVDLLDKELLVKLKNSGCRALALGIESGDNYILDSVSKGITKELASSVIKDCNKVGINTFLNFILGFPNDTKATLNSTYKFAIKHMRYCKTVNFAILVPFPGTEIYNMACNKEYDLNFRSKDWSDFGKQSGASLIHPNFKNGELAKIQARYYLLCYLRKPWLIPNLFSFGRAISLIKKFF